MTIIYNIIEIERLQQFQGRNEGKKKKKRSKQLYYS